MNRKKQLIIIKTATIKNTTLFGVILLIMAFFIMPEAEREIELYANGIGRIDGVFYYLPDQIYDIIGTYGDKGRSLYIAVELTADFFNAVIIALFMGSLMIWSAFISKNKSISFDCLVWLPILLLFTDCLENTGIIWMLLDFPKRHFSLSLATSVFAFSKTMLTLACLTIAGRNMVSYSVNKLNLY